MSLLFKTLLHETECALLIMRICICREGDFLPEIIRQCILWYVIIYLSIGIGIRVEMYPLTQYRDEGSKGVDVERQGADEKSTNTEQPRSIHE